MTRLLTDDGVGAAEGLACDEALAQRVGRGASPPTLRLYTYRAHCALVGRFQDVAHEVELERCAREHVGVNRRPTGGGAILMGPDQLGVALVVAGAERRRPRELMERLSRGLLRGLAELGVAASFRGKNDLAVGGRKLAGLGVYRDPSGALLFHASVLVDLDVALMARVLRMPFPAVGERELAVLAGRTVTVRRLVGAGVALDDVRAAVRRGFGADAEPTSLTAAERGDVAALVRDKYATREWVFQRTDVPDTAGAAELCTPEGRLDVRVALAGGTIKAAHLRGDFFASESAVADLEGRLRWHSSDPGAIAATVRAWSRGDGALAPEPLARAIAAAVERAREPSDPYGCFATPEASRA